MDISILNKEKLVALLDMPTVIKIVESVYSQKSNQSSITWNTITHEFEEYHAEIDIKSGYLRDSNIFGHKTVALYKDNIAMELPSLNGMICVFDSNTGIPIGITEGSYITGMRTGAAAAIGAKYLANPNPKKALIIGAGNQLKFQVAGLLTVFPDIKEIEIFARNIAKVKESLYLLPKQLKMIGIKKINTHFSITKNLNQSIKTSQIIITITSSKSPIVQTNSITTGTHLSTMGADMVSKQEIDEMIFSNAVVFADDLKNSSQFGEMQTALRKNIISLTDIQGEIGDLILNKTSGRQSKEDITIFDATGIALLDIAIAKIAIDISKKNHTGVSLKF